MSMQLMSGTIIVPGRSGAAWSTMLHHAYLLLCMLVVLAVSSFETLVKSLGLLDKQ